MNDAGADAIFHEELVRKEKRRQKRQARSRKRRGENGKKYLRENWLMTAWIILKRRGGDDAEKANLREG